MHSVSPTLIIIVIIVIAYKKCVNRRSRHEVKSQSTSPIIPSVTDSSSSTIEVEDAGVQVTPTHQNEVEDVRVQVTPSRPLCPKGRTQPKRIAKEKKAKQKLPFK